MNHRSLRLYVYVCQVEVKMRGDNCSPLVYSISVCLFVCIHQSTQSVYQCVCLCVQHFYSLLGEGVCAWFNEASALLSPLCLFRKTHVDSGPFQILLITFLWQQTQQDPINVLAQTKKRLGLSCTCITSADGRFIISDGMYSSMRLFGVFFFASIPTFISVWFLQKAADSVLWAFFIQ